MQTHIKHFLFDKLISAIAKANGLEVSSLLVSPEDMETKSLKDVFGNLACVIDPDAIYYAMAEDGIVLPNLDCGSPIIDVLWTMVPFSTYDLCQVPESFKSLYIGLSSSFEVKPIAPPPKEEGPSFGLSFEDEIEALRVKYPDALIAGLEHPARTVLESIFYDYGGLLPQEIDELKSVIRDPMFESLPHNLFFGSPFWNNYATKVEEVLTRALDLRHSSVASGLHRGIRLAMSDEDSFAVRERPVIIGDEEISGRIHDVLEERGVPGVMAVRVDDGSGLEMGETTICGDFFLVPNSLFVSRVITDRNRLYAFAAGGRSNEDMEQLLEDIIGEIDKYVPKL